MGKFFGTVGVLASVIVGAVVWFVLDVIIGVTVWVSFLVGGVVAVLGILLALGAFGMRSTASHRHDHRAPLGAR